MENIETGLLLMVVGMTTVFAILLIVINLGKGLIVLGTNGHSNANHRNRQSFRTGDSRHRIGNQRRYPWTGESYQN